MSGEQDGTQVVRVRASGSIPPQDRWAARVHTCPFAEHDAAPFLLRARDTRCFEETEGFPLYDVQRGALMPRECGQNKRVKGVKGADQDSSKVPLAGMAQSALAVLPTQLHARSSR